MEKLRPSLILARIVEVEENEFAGSAVMPLARHLATMVRLPEHRSSINFNFSRSCQKHRLEGVKLCAVMTTELSSIATSICRSDILGSRTVVIDILHVSYAYQSPISVVESRDPT